MDFAVIPANGRKGLLEFRDIKQPSILRIVPVPQFVIQHGEPMDYGVNLVFVDPGDRVVAIAPPFSLTQASGVYTKVESDALFKRASVTGVCYNVSPTQVDVHLFNLSLTTGLKAKAMVVPGRAQDHLIPESYLTVLTLGLLDVVLDNSTSVVAPPFCTGYWLDVDPATSMPDVKQFGHDMVEYADYPALPVSASSFAGRLSQRFFPLHPLCAWLKIVSSGASAERGRIIWNCFM